MSIRFDCSRCGHRLKADESAAGRRAKCTQCGNVVTIPGAEGAAAEVRGEAGRTEQGRGTEWEGAAGSFVRRREAADDDEIDMTPMIDVVFQLLIFFMVTAAFALEKSIPVPVPQQASNTPQAGVPDDQDAVTVRIDSDDGLWVDGVQAVSRQDLIAKLRKLRGGAGGRRTLLVSADPECRHETVVTALDAGSAAGMEEVELVTDEEK